MDCRRKLLRKLFVRKGLFSRLIQFLEIPAGSPTPSTRRESSQGNEAPLGQHSRRNDQCQSIHAVWCELFEERRMGSSTSLFCWGSLLGWSFLAFCFLTHIAASLDVVRQRAFPVFPRSVALAAAIPGMGLTVYLPSRRPVVVLCVFDMFRRGVRSRLSGEPSSLSGEGTIARTLHLDAVVAGVKPADRPSGRRRGTGTRMDGSTLAGRWQGPPVETSRGAALLPECLAVPGAAEPRCHRARDHQRDCRT